MIAHLKGTIFEKHPNQVILDTGGVAIISKFPSPLIRPCPIPDRPFRCECILTSEKMPSSCLASRRRKGEIKYFERLISVSGIGPKLAITVLSGLATPDIIAAIRTADIQRLVRIPGHCGKKTAERMVLELKDKLMGVEIQGKEAAAARIWPRAERTRTRCAVRIVELGMRPASG